MPLQISLMVWPLVVFFAFWAVTWPFAKRTKERQRLSEWFPYWILFVVAAVLILVPASVPAFGNIPLLGVQLAEGSFAPQAFGLALEVLGLCVAIWARVTLGGNWSSAVAFKENHKLVTSGPYRFVRHPIYTGMMAMFLGVAVYLGAIVSFLGILFLFASFWIKSRQEERLMEKHFPKEYGKYKKTTKALIPFVY